LANEKLSLLPEDDIPKIIPRPVRFDRKSGEFFIDASIPIQHPPELKSEADYLAVAFQSLIGTQLVRVPETEDRSIRLSIGQVAVQNETKVSGDQAYQMIVDPRSGISIIGTDPAGVFYGIQSLRALVAPRSYASEQPRIRIPAVSITDFPLFKYRGQHLDVARNFQTHETVKKLLELMAFYKMNKFHFHITDDEGWRVEIPGLPELTEIGSRRGHTLNESDRLVPSFGSGPDPAYSHGTGFYTRDQFIDILRFAKARHIEVIPEIDLPGHARAAIVSMNRRYDRLIQAGNSREAEEYLLSDPNDESVYKSVQGWRDNVVNVCRESTYTFISKVVDELKSAYSEAEAPFSTVHTGGDEVPSGVWLRSPICNQEIQSKGLEKVQDQKDLPDYFVHRFNQILNERGLITAGWEEIALSGDSHGTEKSPNPDFVEKNLLAYVWNSVWGWGGEENAYRLANAGYQVVLCNASNLYLDMAYEKHPLEPGYYWAGFVDTRKPFEFIPYNIYASAATDLMGKPVDPDLQLRSTGLTPQGRRNVVGIQSQLWSENAKGQDLFEYLVFPKILASAERAWSPQPPWALETNPDRRSAAIESDWNFFVNAIGQREMVRLNFLEGGVNYRIPPPGVIIRDGKLEANTAFPGLIVRYTTDGSEPSENSEIYPGPIRVSGTVKLKAFNSKGRGSRTSVIID
jgi:hexosaminidase